MAAARRASPIVSARPLKGLEKNGVSLLLVDLPSAELDPTWRPRRSRRPSTSAPGAARWPGHRGSPWRPGASQRATRSRATTSVGHHTERGGRRVGAVVAGLGDDPRHQGHRTEHGHDGTQRHQLAEPAGPAAPAGEPGERQADGPAPTDHQRGGQPDQDPAGRIVGDAEQEEGRHGEEGTGDRRQHTDHRRRRAVASAATKRPAKPAPLVAVGLVVVTGGFPGPADPPIGRSCRPPPLSPCPGVIGTRSA